MTPKVDCPFLTADRILAEETGRVDAALVEIHAEATSEKIALGRHLAGRAAIVVGTHTHVPTADVTVLPGGTAYQTDAGMCGPYDGVIGRDSDPVIARFLDGLPASVPRSLPCAAPRLPPPRHARWRPAAVAAERFERRFMP